MSIIKLAAVESENIKTPEREQALDANQNSAE
jgi:hypothetical protein